MKYKEKSMVNSLYCMIVSSGVITGYLKILDISFQQTMGLWPTQLPEIGMARRQKQKKEGDMFVWLICEAFIYLLWRLLSSIWHSDGMKGMGKWSLIRTWPGHWAHTCQGPALAISQSGQLHCSMKRCEAGFNQCGVCGNERKIT